MRWPRGAPLASSGGSCLGGAGSSSGSGRLVFSPGLALGPGPHGWPLGSLHGLPKGEGPSPSVIQALGLEEAGSGCLLQHPEVRQPPSGR